MYFKRLYAIEFDNMVKMLNVDFTSYKTWIFSIQYKS